MIEAVTESSITQPIAKIFKERGGLTQRSTNIKTRRVADSIFSQQEL